MLGDWGRGLTHDADHHVTPGTGAIQGNTIPFFCLSFFLLKIKSWPKCKPRYQAINVLSVSH
jgi:hypothetical protein